MKSKIMNTDNAEFKELLTKLPFKKENYEAVLDQMYLDNQIGRNESIINVTGTKMRIHWTKISEYRFNYSGISALV